MQPGQGVAGVLDRVVQQRGDQGRGVHAQIGEDLRNRERVGDVVFAADPLLAPVHPFGGGIGLAHQRDVAVRMDLPVCPEQVGDRFIGRVRGPRQHGP